jgi:hypothetical protein
MVKVFNEFTEDLDLVAFSRVWGDSGHPMFISKLMVKSPVVSDSRRQAAGFPIAQEMID